jgi:hypothetical protein
VRARPSRRADDGSHRLHTRNARAVCHRAGRRPIPHGTAIIASAFRAPRGIRAVAPGSRGATRGRTFDCARRPRGRRSSVRPPFRSSAQAEVAPEACSPADTTAGAGTRDAHAGQRHLGRSRRAARPDPAANSRRQGQGESEGAREGQANGQAPRARAAGRARGDDDDDDHNDDAAAGGGVRAARGREGSWQRQGEGPRQRARRVVPVRG